MSVALDLPAAATLLGIGPRKAYELVHDDECQTSIIRLGKLINARLGAVTVGGVGRWRPSSSTT